MAHIEKITRKKGVHYRITVSGGFDVNGNRIRHRREYYPEPGMSEAKGRKAAERVAVEFERAIELGFQVDNKQTFAQYAEYVLDTKAANGRIRPTTLQRYRSLLDRINGAIGHMQLGDIRPQHLNEFYRSLLQDGSRENNYRAKAIVDLEAVIREECFNYDSLSRECGVGSTTISAMCKGEHVMPKKAEAVAEELERPFKSLFTLVKLQKGGLDAKTILEYHRLISSVLAQAEREMIVFYNAAQKAMPPKSKKKKPNYFQPEEIYAILEKLPLEPVQWQAMIHLFLITGCRRSEIAGLRWEKLDLDKGRLCIDEGLYFTKEEGLYQSETKTGDTRYLHLPDETVHLLKQHRYEQLQLRLINGNRWQDTGYVFTRDSGAPMRPDCITQWMANFSKRHGLKHMNPHAFRHSLASVLLAHGTDVVTVSKQLGHASVTTTENYYSHIIEGFMETATERAADIFLRKAK